MSRGKVWMAEMSDVEAAAFVRVVADLRNSAGAQTRARRALGSILADTAADLGEECARRARLAGKFAEVEASTRGVAVVGVEGPQQ